MTYHRAIEPEAAAQAGDLAVYACLPIGHGLRRR